MIHRFLNSITRNCLERITGRVYSHRIFPFLLGDASFIEAINSGFKTIDLEEKTLRSIHVHIRDTLEQDLTRLIRRYKSHYSSVPPQSDEKLWKMGSVKRRNGFLTLALSGRVRVKCLPAPCHPVYIQHKEIVEDGYMTHQE